MSSVEAVVKRSSQHTPGPWKVPTGYSDFQVHGPDGFRVADVFTLNRHAAECEANARLIAAAPELLALAHDVLLTRDEHTPARVIAAAQAVIAKVEGREPA